MDSWLNSSSGSDDQGAAAVAAWRKADAYYYASMARLQRTAAAKTTSQPLKNTFCTLVSFNIQNKKKVERWVVAVFIFERRRLGRLYIHALNAFKNLAVFGGLRIQNLRQIHLESQLDFLLVKCIGCPAGVPTRRQLN